ncbi:MAG TPA: tetratricopeptide repeat protein [Opitutaceae bacterium]|nr:tetratricopeptide repeat protein [Opitutaceae bacterium]
MFYRAAIPYIVFLFLCAAKAAAQTRSNASSPQLTAETLPQLLERAVTEFGGGRFAPAADAFGVIERDFGREPQWTEGTLPRKVLPLRGYAQLRAGRASDATRSFDEFLERFPDEAGQRSFVLYASALALMGEGRNEDAEKRFGQFITDFGGTAQAALAQGQRAELLFKLSRDAEGHAVLADVAANAPSSLLRTQARLRALQRAIEVSDAPRTRELLLGSPWAIDTMPELGMLAFSAMQAGDRWLAAGDAADAIAAFRLVLPKERLVVAQRQRLADLRRVFAERAPSAAAGAGAVWVDFYRGLIGRVESQLVSLEAAEDYTHSLRMRQAHSFLLGGRTHEAWLLLEGLATGADTDATLRTESHYRWILAAAALNRWDEALAIARAFVERNQFSELAPTALYMIAQAHLEQQRHAESVEVLGDLILHYPEHEMRPRFIFTRGYCLAVLNRLEEARAEFAQCYNEFPNGPLASSARLWHALAHYFEKNYPKALDELESLAKSEKDRPLEGEILHRRATTLYALRRNEEAADAAADFLEQFPHHVREDEARVLFGDVCMALGRLDEAKVKFAEVPPENGTLFVYAAFQTGKILRAEEEYEKLADFFTRYAARPDLPGDARVGEALYWIGWARTQQERIGEAFPVFFDAIARFGNDPRSGEFQPLITALERLHRRARIADAAGSVAAAGLLGTKVFADWIESEREAAAVAGKLTLYSRYSLWLADAHTKANRPHQTETVLLEIAGRVPVERLDPGGLGRVGAALQSIGSGESANYYTRLLEEYPASFERAWAYHGLATIALAEGRRERALDWLERIVTETPTHPLGTRATLDSAELLASLGKTDLAAERLEGLLRLKSARGRPHAEALSSLGAIRESAGDSAQAIAYYQRVYTLYRAQADLVADAYMRSGNLFEKRGDKPAALRTFEEFTAQTALAGTVPFPAAIAARDRLRADPEIIALAAPKPEPEGAP